MAAVRSVDGFQFLLGRLDTSGNTPWSSFLIWFQFLLGRLETFLEG